ncbi:MAG TPA: LysE family transporter [Salinivirgaceae bacterium]|nr:LysE family transporter [Salinivirgaceae bacterium]
MIAEAINSFSLLIKGVIIGLAASAPLGPIGVLCVQKTISKGRTIGFLSGLGAATADTVYAIIATFGIGFIQQFLEDNQSWISILGLIVLFFLGVNIFLANPISQARHRHRQKYKGVFGDYISVFVLTLSNPLTVIFFGASIAAMGVFCSGHPLYAQFFVVIGVFCGAVLWWFSLTGVVSLLRHKFRLKQLWWLNKISGAIIVLLSIVAAVSLILYR